jgi:hypothetical protein
VIDLPDDFRDLLVELHDAGADFVVGGHAVAFHGHPRATRDLDLLIRADEENATGITFDEAVAEGAHFELEGRRIRIIGRSALLKNKRAAGRPQDLADVSALER